MLTVGYMPYILGNCEKYPLLVHSIVWPDKNTGYDHITLSGVVADDSKNMSDAEKKRMSIELSVIVTFHMPCCTKVQNSPTTFSVAIGKNMAINLLIGMALIRSTKITMDFDDPVVEVKALATKPFNLVIAAPSVVLHVIFQWMNPVIMHFMRI